MERSDILVVRFDNGLFPELKIEEAPGLRSDYSATGKGYVSGTRLLVEYTLGNCNISTKVQK